MALIRDPSDILVVLLDGGQNTTAGHSAALSATPSRRVADEIVRMMEKAGHTYVTDAYHSLSIEGYRVLPET